MPAVQDVNRASGKDSTRSSSQRRSREILEAARVLLSEQGYEQFSLRKVAASAGIHLKTLQHYYPSKDVLLQSTLEYTDSLYLNTTREILAGEGDARDHFETYIRYLIDDHKKRQTVGFFYQLWARAHVDDATRETMAEMYASHCRNIENLIHPMNPELDDQTRRQRAVMIAALMEGMMLFVGYGKKRPRGIGSIEDEVVSQCLKIAAGQP